MAEEKDKKMTAPGQVCVSCLGPIGGARRGVRYASGILVCESCLKQGVQVLGMLKQREDLREVIGLEERESRCGKQLRAAVVFLCLQSGIGHAAVADDFVALLVLRRDPGRDPGQVFCVGYDPIIF